MIRKLENTNRVLLNRMNEKNKDTLKKVGEKKSKRRKGGNKSRKERKLRRKGPGEKNVGAKCGRSSRAINETCITNILAMYAVYAGQMKNFEKQLKRIQAKNKTSKNKGGEQQIVF